MRVVRVEVDGRVAVVTFEELLVDAALLAGLAPVADLLDSGEVGAAVFRSRDPDFFLMHGDVEAILAVPPHDHVPASGPNPAAALFERLHRAPCLTVAVLDGIARGGGCELVLALDLRFGTERARVGQPEVAMGILPGAGGTVRWPRLAGRATALEVILSGRDLAADELHAIGFLDRLTSAAEVEAMALARRVARMPQASIAAVKRVVDGGDLTAESDELGRLLATGAQAEPMRAFLAAGGQTRHAEAGPIDELLDAMLDRHT